MEFLIYCSQPFQQVILDYDYTFTTPYCGSEEVYTNSEEVRFFLTFLLLTEGIIFPQISCLSTPCVFIIMYHPDRNSVSQELQNLLLNLQLIINFDSFKFHSDQVGRDIVDGGPSLCWEDCEEKIDMVALASKEPILFYDEVVN